MKNTPYLKRPSNLGVPLPWCAWFAFLIATATGFSQTVILPNLQARLGATTANLGKVQDSVIHQAEEMASRQIGFVAGEYPEEFRNFAVFKLVDTGLASSDVAKATLEVVATHQLGAKTPRIAVAQLLPSGGGSDFVFNNYNMYQEQEGEILLKEGEWAEPHRIDITKILKSALDQADETHGIVFRIWLVSDESGDLADYDNREVKASSLGTVDLKIEVQKAR
ncbi:MAG: hypothetical protein ACOYMS_07725 [Terrimicrobiaceae bacterium]